MDRVSDERLKEYASWGSFDYDWYQDITAMAQELLFLRARADAEPEWSADGSISVEDAVARVLELHPGADRLALPTLANALAHPAPSSMRLVPEEATTPTVLVNFYEREFYPLSNFSAFTLLWKGFRFDTSEAAYHWEKFPHNVDLQIEIIDAASAHEAFKLAERRRADRRPDWDEIKVDVMRDILRAKAQQHEYVRRKLLETGDRELVECSWRDDFWGWGPNRDGKNMLGKLWMEIRAELRAAAPEAK